MDLLFKEKASSIFEGVPRGDRDEDDGWESTIDMRLLEAARTYFFADATCKRCYDLIRTGVLYNSEIEIYWGKEKLPLRNEFWRIVREFGDEALKQILIDGFFPWNVPKNWRKMLVLHPQTGIFQTRRDYRGPPDIRFVTEKIRSKHQKRPREAFEVDGPPTRSDRQQKDNQHKIHRVTIVHMPEPSGQLTSVMGGVLARCWMIEKMAERDQYAAHILSDPPMVLTERDNAMAPGSDSLAQITVQSTIDARVEKQQMYSEAMNAAKQHSEMVNNDQTTMNGVTRVTPDPFFFCFPDPHQQIRGMFYGNEHILQGKQLISQHLPQRDQHLIDWDARRRELICEAFGLPVRVVSGEAMKVSADATITQSEIRQTMEMYAELLRDALTDVINRAFYRGDTEDLKFLIRSTSQNIDVSKSLADLANPRRYEVKIVLRPYINTEQVLRIAEAGHLSEENARKLIFDQHGIPKKYGEGAPGVVLAKTALLLREQQTRAINGEELKRDREKASAEKDKKDKKKEKKEEPDKNISESPEKKQKTK